MSTTVFMMLMIVPMMVVIMPFVIVVMVVAIQFFRGYPLFNDLSAINHKL